MRHATRFVMVATLAVLIFAGRTSWAQSQATTTETRKFEIVAVEGNKVIVKGESGSRELTVPPDFKMTVDGKDVSVADLKPGMKGTATITTTTTSTPVQVTEIREGEVVSATGNSVTVKTANGFRMFGPGDMQKRNAKIYKDGQPINFADLQTGDRLTAVIVTEGPPVVLTERQVKAAMTTPAPAPAAPPPAAAPPPPPPPTPVQTPEPEPKKLPTTASDRPLYGAIGVMSLLLAMSLALRRRSSTVR